MGAHEQLCLECGEPFTASRSDAITCSNSCRARRGRRLRWRQIGHIRFRDVEASPDDEMFNMLHVAFPSDPEAPETEKARVRWSPYVHSPEEGTPEAEQVPWTIHIPIGPETEAEVDPGPDEN